MSMLAEHHKPKAGVVGKCSVPMWSAGCPAGFCDRPAYGQQYAEGSPFAPQWWSPRDRNGHYLDPNSLPPYAPGLCCEGHGGPSETGTRFMRDGNMWMAFRPGFENLQESIAGFGPTQAAAYDDMASRIAQAIEARKAQT